MLIQPNPLKGRNRIKVAHVLGKMDRGGAETWLMHVLRTIDREKYQLDFIVHTIEPGDYDEEIIQLGSKIIPCLSSAQPWKYYKNMKRIFCAHGPYDVVHSHVHHFSGFVLKIAEKAGIPIRIAHSHTDSSGLQHTISRRFYLAVMKNWIDHYATLGLAVSERAAFALFGPKWKMRTWIKIHPCGIDLAPFREKYNSREVRSEFGIDENAFVIGHIGRFDENKNQKFLLDVFDQIAEKDLTAVLLLVGVGPLLPFIKRKVEDKNLSEKVFFPGKRKDIPRILMGAMDVFLLPSLHEGLSLVAVEAQAAGKKLIRSEEISGEVDIVKPLVRKVSNKQMPEIWAKAILETKNQERLIPQEKALQIVENTQCNILRGIKELEGYFEGKHGKREIHA